MPLPTPDMMRVLKFSLDELDLNRAGKLSSHQVMQSVKSAAFDVPFALFILAMFAFIVLVLRPTGWHRVLLYVMSLGGVGITCWLASVSVLDLVVRRVVVHEGALEFTSVGRGAGIVVARNIIATGPCADVLVGGGMYRVYSLAHSNRFLSIEPLDAAAIPVGSTAPTGGGMDGDMNK